MELVLLTAIFILVVLVFLRYRQEPKVVKVVQPVYTYRYDNPWYGDFGWRPWDRFRRRFGHRRRRWWR